MSSINNPALPPPQPLSAPQFGCRSKSKQNIENSISLISPSKESSRPRSLVDRCTPAPAGKRSSPLLEILTPPSGLKQYPSINPLVYEGFEKTIEALNLKSSPPGVKDQILDAFIIIFENKEKWKQEPPISPIFSLNGIPVAYDRNLHSITVTIQGHEIDFDSLFFTNPPKSGLSSEEFHEEHLFIIKNQVRYVKHAQLQEQVPGQVKHSKAIYITTKVRIRTDNTFRRLKRSLMFTFDNKVIMHLTKKAFTGKIGKGRFKTLSLAVNLKTQEEMASAGIPLVSEKQIKSFVKEVYWGRHPVIASHPNFLKILGVVEYITINKQSSQKIKKARILYPLLKGQDLFDSIEQPKTPLTMAERDFIFQELGKIVFDLHSKNIAFKDIKLENFFITRDPNIPREGHNQIQVVAIDFGGLQNNNDPTTLSGVILYMAPEYRRALPSLKQTVKPQTPIKDIDKKKGDVWALGIVFSVMLKGSRWAKQVLSAIFDADDNKNAEIHNLPPEPRDQNCIEYLIWRMLQIDPRKRADMREVCQFLSQDTARSLVNPPPLPPAGESLPSLVEILSPSISLKQQSLVNPILYEGYQKTIEALNLKSFSAELKDQILKAFIIIFENKETWRQEPPIYPIFSLNGIPVAYDSNLHSITVTIGDRKIDFDSLFFTNPPKSGLSPEEFYEEHLFIIKKQVQYVQYAQSLEQVPGPVQLSKAIYLSTKMRIEKNTTRRLKRSLMFTFDNKVIMHLTKKAFTKKIGKGAFKTVSLAVNLKTQEEMASASMPLLTEKQQQNFVKEVYWGRHPAIASHPNCLKILSVVEYTTTNKKSLEQIKKARILYPLLKGEDLFDSIKQTKTPLTIEERSFIFQELAKIVFDIHRAKIAFKDIKLENFFITRDPSISREGHNQIQVVALDFGLLQHNSDKTTLSGSTLYFSPEYRRFVPSYKKTISPLGLVQDIDKQKGDVWALAIVFSAMLKDSPWAQKVGNAVIKAHDTNTAEIHDLPPEPQDQNSIEYLIWRMLQIDPTKRADMAEVHQFLNPDRAQSLVDRTALPSPGKGSSSSVEILSPPSGLKQYPSINPLVYEGFQKTIEALNLKSSPAALKDQILDAFIIILENKEKWKQEPPISPIFSLNGIPVAYDRNLDAITISIGDSKIDFDSLFFTNPPQSGLSAEEFHEEHLFIIKNQVKYVKHAQLLEEVPGPVKYSKAIYLSTKIRIEKNTKRTLKRSLMFTFDNKVIMHLTKRAFTQKIGKGAFKTVSLAVNLKTQEEMASASIPLVSEKHMKSFVKEVYWGRHPAIASHPNCLKLLSVVEYITINKQSFQQIHKARILYPLLKGQNLFDSIEQPKTPLTIAERDFIFQELAKIVFDLHAVNIAFKDIKPHNFFITRDSSIPREGHNQIQVVALDFGLLQHNSDETIFSGSKMFLSPEYRRTQSSQIQTISPKIALKNIDKQKGDVWALGVTFCIMLKNNPWADGVLNAILNANKVNSAEIHDLPPQPKDKNSIEYIISRMLEINPRKRATMDEVYRFFSPDSTPPP